MRKVLKSIVDVDFGSVELSDFGSVEPSPNPRSKGNLASVVTRDSAICLSLIA